MCIDFLPPFSYFNPQCFRSNKFINLYYNIQYEWKLPKKILQMNFNCQNCLQYNFYIFFKFSAFWSCYSGMLHTVCIIISNFQLDCLFLFTGSFCQPWWRWMEMKPMYPICTNTWELGMGVSQISACRILHTGPNFRCTCFLAAENNYMSKRCCLSSG